MPFLVLTSFTLTSNMITTAHKNALGRTPDLWFGFFGRRELGTSRGQQALR